MSKTLPLFSHFIFKKEAKLIPKKLDMSANPLPFNSLPSKTIRMMSLVVAVPVAASIVTSPSSHLRKDSLYFRQACCLAYDRSCSAFESGTDDRSCLVDKRWSPFSLKLVSVPKWNSFFSSSVAAICVESLLWVITCSSFEILLRSASSRLFEFPIWFAQNFLRFEWLYRIEKSKRNKLAYSANTLMLLE